MSSMILALDVGGTFIKWALYDGNAFVKHGKIPTPSERESFFAALQKALDDAGEPVEGMTFSIAGTVDPETGYILQGGALQYNNGTNLIEDVKERFGLKCAIENDARSAMLAEMDYGSLKDAESGLVIVVGTAIGGSFEYHGEILRGYHNYAGEVSNIVLEGDLRDNMHTPNFALRCGMRYFLMRAEKELCMEHMNGEIFMDLVRAGNETAVRLMKEYAKDFTKALFNIQLIVDPQKIVIGGGISRDETYMEYIRTAWKEIVDAFYLPYEGAEIVTAMNGNDANLLGAVANYRRHFQAR